ncbi:uncharacterized protein LOC128204733 [Mya arenaria]|uniref:uncharacterized protein LOC128204727 n=1 Tax=Mya arenaria TaxID=6604 RepID=UPI0022E4BC0D|nr:uncharacterized protein LOC128204727 [Mya arenaria]XP_052762097.1 uncharacterized protein LOC128204733 [Mya arenaria]
MSVLTGLMEPRLLVVMAIFVAMVTGQMFDKNPTIYDHMKSGANTVKSNLIESELQIEKLFMPDECVLNDEDFYGDRQVEIEMERQRLRLIQAEEGDTVTLHYTLSLDDGTVLDKSIHEPDDIHAEEIIIPAIFSLGYQQVITGWEIGVTGMCVGEVRKITIPPQLAYGPNGYKQKNIPADATLEIETKLVSLKKKDMVDHYMDFLRNLHVYTFFILGLTFLMGGFYKGQIAEKRRLYREIAERKRQREIENEIEDDEDDECDDEVADNSEENVSQETGDIPQGNDWNTSH